MSQGRKKAQSYRKSGEGNGIGLQLSKEKREEWGGRWSWKNENRRLGDTGGTESNLQGGNRVEEMGADGPRLKGKQAGDQQSLVLLSRCCSRWFFTCALPGASSSHRTAMLSLHVSSDTEQVFCTPALWSLDFHFLLSPQGSQCPCSSRGRISLCPWQDGPAL